MSEAHPGSHESTLSSERGFDGKLVHVRVDKVRLPSGGESVREVVEHPGAVAILGLTSDDRVIFVRQWRHAVGQELFELPAGTREPNELPVDTARRELLEETGYEAGSITEIVRFYLSAGFLDEELTLYLAEECVSGNQVQNADERTTVVLVPRSETRMLLEPGENRLRDAKSLIGILWLLANRVNP